MKIINKEKLTKCKLCKSDIEFTPKDVKHTFLLKSPYINCPVCKNRIYLEEVEVVDKEKEEKK